MQKVCNAIVILLLVAVCFGLYVCYDKVNSINASVTDLVNAGKPKEIDRTPYVLYPKDEYAWHETVFVFYMQDCYYHDTDECEFKIYNYYAVNLHDKLRMSKYEAEKRGFQPCPNCYFPNVDIRKK